MRALVALLVLSAAPVQASSVVAYSFGKPAPASTSYVNGVQVEATGEFVLYALGPPRPLPKSEAAVPEAAAPFFSPAPPVETEGLTARESCRRTALPPPVARLSRVAERERLRHWATIVDVECRYDLPAGLLDALVLTESRYRQQAISHAGAAGLAQLMPATARELGVLDRFDPLANLDGGARYLRQQLERFGEIDLALAAYNAGPAAVARRWRIPANGETPGYVRSVLGFWSASSADPLSSARRTAMLLGFTKAN